MSFRVLKILFPFLPLLCSLSAMAQQGTMRIDTTAHLLIFYPDSLCRFDLACGVMPSADDEQVLFCGAGAFTRDTQQVFSHQRIFGPHLSQGDSVRVGYIDAGQEPNYGIFAYAEGRGVFLPLADSVRLPDIAARGGMAFTQHWVVRESSVWPRWTFRADRTTHFRVIAEHDGRICIIESRQAVRYDRFLDYLTAYGVSNAMNMDMGPGWNHSFCRDASSRLHILHPAALRSPCCTNWFTIRR